MPLPVTAVAHQMPEAG